MKRCTQCNNKSETQDSISLHHPSFKLTKQPFSEAKTSQGLSAFLSSGSRDTRYLSVPEDKYHLDCQCKQHRQRSTDNLNAGSCLLPPRLTAITYLKRRKAQRKLPEIASSPETQWERTRFSAAPSNSSEGKEK